MSESQVIARRFRPQAFNQVVGQEAITRTLTNAIKSDRLHHAYLFTGARGVGKTTTARILAKALNCHQGVTIEPCGVCPSCEEIAGSRSIDVLEIDAASNTGVDNVRDVIINSIQIAPARDRHKIFIIDEVHMLSNAAFNALLKTLEEPPPRVVFILATTELQKVPDTILSRCQVFEFRTISTRRIFEQLRQIAADLRLEISEAALLTIARAGDGSMRDAESALDQVISFAGQSVKDDDVSAALGLVDLETLNQTMQAIAGEDSRRVLRIVDEVVSRGYDLRNFCREMMVHTRAVLVTKVAGFEEELVQMPQAEAAALCELADSFSEQDLLRFFSILTETEQNIRLSSQPRFQLEMGLIKLVQARRLYLLEEALERISAIEARLGGGPARPPAAPPTSGRGPVRSADAESTGSRTGGNPASSPPRENAATTDQPAALRATAGALSDSAPPYAQPALDHPYEADAIAAAPAKAKPASSADELERIKEALRSKKRMLVISTLEQAQTLVVEGGSLRIVYSPEFATSKRVIDGKDTRRLLEEACREALGRELRVSVSIAGESEALEAPPTRRTAPPKPKVVEDPAVRAILDTFHGEVIDVIEPEE